MKFVITGGTGLIGTALVHSLSSDGHDVVILSRRPERLASVFESPRVSSARWDGKSHGEWARHLEGADAVINLAGENISGDSFPPKRWTDARKRLIYQSRIDGAQALVNAINALHDKPKALIHNGGIDWYGSSTADTLVTEDSPAGSSFLARVAQDTEAVFRPLDESLRLVFARTGIVFANEGGAWPPLVLPFKFIIAGGPLGSGRQYFAWVHIDDAVAALKWMAVSPEARGAYIVSAPQAQPQKEIAAAIGRVLGRPSFFPTPGIALELALGEVAALVLKGQNARPERLQAAGFQWKYADLDSAVRNLLGK